MNKIVHRLPKNLQTTHFMKIQSNKIMQIWSGHTNINNSFRSCFHLLSLLFLFLSSLSRNYVDKFCNSNASWNERSSMTSTRIFSWTISLDVTLLLYVNINLHVIFTLSFTTPLHKKILDKSKHF